MKLPLLAAILLLSALVFYFSGMVIQPNDAQAAFVWNFTLALAPLAALVFEWKMARERQLQPLVFLTVLAVINTSLVLGSRLGAWRLADWSRVLTTGTLPELPGKTVLGGMVLAILLFVLLRRWWRFSLEMADTIVVGLPVAGLVARIGCLTAGCCYGIMTGTEHGICYGPGTPAYTHQLDAGIIGADALHSLPVYPVQYFILAGNALIFIVLWKFRNRFSQPGALMLLGLGLLSAQRFGIEFIRDVATNRGTFGVVLAGLKGAQWLTLFITLASATGFWWILRKKQGPSHPIRATQNQLSLVIFGIAAGVFLLRSMLTLDEILIILLSTLPAMAMLARKLWTDYRLGRQVFTAGAVLSGAAIVLLSSPVDSSIVPRKQWMEVGVGGSSGSYYELVRDCNGNELSRSRVKHQATGLDISSNWKNGNTYTKIGIRGVSGESDPVREDLYALDYKYFNYGLYGGVSHKVFGATIGLVSNNLNYRTNFDWLQDETRLYPMFNLRIGKVSRYSVDFRFYDEPALGFANEPPVSLGLVNWGFRDPSGGKRIRLGMAFASNSENALTVSSKFPLGNMGLYGEFCAYVGNINIIQAGLRFKFKEVEKK